MKKIFLFAAAIVASATLSAATDFEFCILDSAKFVSIAGAETATKTKVDFAAGTVFHEGENMKVTLPFATQTQWLSAEQPNGAHKSIMIGDLAVISMSEAFQGNDNPKDADGGNPCNTLLEPASGALFQVDAKEDGWVVVLHKASSNKQYFVFEEGSPLGYKFGMMTYAEKTLGENGLLRYELVGDEDNYLTAANLLETTGFDKIAWVEDYFNDTLTSGIAWETYKQNGVSAVAFQAYEGLTYLVGAAGSKMTCAAIIFIKDLEGTLEIKARGETVKEDGKEDVTYNDVVLVELEASTEAIDNVNVNGKAVKTFENGQLVIIKNGVRYNALGAQL